MIVCPSCQTQNMDGTFFCADCGASFLPSRLRETTTSLGVPSSSDPAPFTPTHITAPVPEIAAPSLRVVILNSGRKLGFTSEQPIMIGRQDSGRSFYPDIDLSTDGGLDAGVSRRHASITQRDGQCFIEDLESANGTYVNKERLAPRAPAQLRHGDEVRMGNILIRIELTS
jgi:pSer/pThr/pTyr-binding forkhead associated (FHA) protein